MSDGWYVTAQDIVVWTKQNLRRAQEKLPLLVRQLILASVEPSSIQIPVGDSILTGGWDGILQVNQGNIFVPIGNSVWEFSTNQNINKKANEDYAKRARNSRGIDKKNTTFVYVTSLKWKDHDIWKQKKNNRKTWNEVRALNADSLELWLKECPAVHRWFARIIGKRPTGALDVEQAWERWRHNTKPASIPGLVLAGRTEQANEFISKLKKGPSIVPVWGDSKEEAYAFTLASIIEYGKVFTPRILIIKDPREWDELIDYEKTHILIPMFENYYDLGAASRYHIIIVPESKYLFDKKQDGIELAKLNKEPLIKALKKMGLKEEIAEKTIKSSRGDLLPIRRRLALSLRDKKIPEWSKIEYSELTLAILFAGAWDAKNPHDQEKLSKIAGISYEEVEKQLDKWVQMDDPPVRKSGNFWQIISKEDAWALLSNYINEKILVRFLDAAIETLSELDPRYEMKPDDKLTAPLYGKVPKHSEKLRRNVAEMLVMLASYGVDCTNVKNVTVQDLVSTCVRKLLTNMSGMKWYSLRNELPLLAEASPEGFLEIVENELNTDKPPLISLFAIDEGFLGGCAYAGLLWALESLSWNLDYLARVALILAKLDKLDPGGKWANRPFISLRHIFTLWLPQTNATLDERLTVIDTILKFEPEIGWKLLLELITLGGGFVSFISQPKYRDWVKREPIRVTNTDQSISAIADRIVNHALNNPNICFPELIKNIERLPDKHFRIIVDELMKRNINDFPDPVRNSIHNELRSIISTHRQHSDVQWALSKEKDVALVEIYDKFSPTDLIKKYAYLFDNGYPALINLKPNLKYEEHQKLLEYTRTAALKEIVSKLGVQGILSLSESVKSPGIVGYSIGILELSGEIEKTILDLLHSNKQPHKEMAKTYARIKFDRNPDWLEKTKNIYFKDWDDITKAEFCLGLSLNKKTYELVNSLGDNAKKYYWENVQTYYIFEKDKTFIENVIEKLLVYNRPYTAIDLASHYLRSYLKTGCDVDLLARVLEHAAASSDRGMNMTTTLAPYNLIEIIRFLQNSPAIDCERLMLIEIKYLHVFQDRTIEPVTLIKHAITNPDFFVYLVCRAYKAIPPIDGEFAGLSQEQIKNAANNAYDILSLINRIPGQNDAGGIDKQQLLDWINNVRTQCSSKNRIIGCDIEIGKILSHAPSGNDGVWPHESVRELIETVKSRKMESSIVIECYNHQGSSFGSLKDFTEKESEHAEIYKKQADKIKLSWPRTSALLMKIAYDYESSAKMVYRDDEILDE